MAHSNLATISVPADASNYTQGRLGTPINKITIHHMAGINSAEGCGRIFQRPGRGGSSHYGIGKDGDIAWYVDEDNIAWADNNWASNCRSVTIENSNDTIGGDWHISDATLVSLVKLVADIAKRHNMGTLVVGQNLTKHKDYAQTQCPGPYLESKMQYIADEANKINNAQPAPAPAPQPSPSGLAVGDKVTPKQYVDYYGTLLLKTRDYYFISAISGDRAVLSADSVNGPIYAAMNTNNLNKVGGGSPSPSDGIRVGDRVTLVKWVDYNGTALYKTRDAYYVSEISGDRVVLRADNMNGPIYCAANINNLRKV